MECVAEGKRQRSASVLCAVFSCFKGFLYHVPGSCGWDIARKNGSHFRPCEGRDIMRPPIS